MTDQDDLFARALRGLDEARRLPAGTMTLDHAELLLGIAPGGPWLVYIAHQPERRFRSLSSGWRSALGWSRRTLLSRTYLDFVHPGDRERTEALLLPGRTLVVPREETFVNRYICRSGEYQEMRWNGLGVDIGGGLVLGTVALGPRTTEDPAAPGHVARISSDDP